MSIENSRMSETKKIECHYCGVLEGRPGCGYRLGMILCPFCRLSFPDVPLLPAPPVVRVAEIRRKVVQLHHDLAVWCDFMQKNQKWCELQVDLKLAASLVRWVDDKDWHHKCQREFSAAATEAALARRMLRPIEPSFTLLDTVVNDGECSLEPDALKHLLFSTVVFPVWSAWSATGNQWRYCEQVHEETQREPIRCLEVVAVEVGEPKPGQVMKANSRW